MKITEIIYQRLQVIPYYEKAGIVLTDEEKAAIEIADFHLGKIDEIGLQLVTYINTERVCAKEMVLMPHQVCPEHRHIPTNGSEGKEETFRCRYGKVFLYTDDNGTSRMEKIHIPVPSTRVTVFHETILLPGNQYTILPGTLHWFAAGDEGAVISEFSTHSTDESDEFTDNRIIRNPVADIEEGR